MNRAGRAGVPWAMLVRSLGVVAAMAGFGTGCTKSQVNTGDDQVPIDAASVQYAPFTSVTWSLALVNGHTQISISDQPGTAACALGADQRNHLSGAGKQIILQLPEVSTDTACPTGSFTQMQCSNVTGTDAFVPMGCTYYREFDAAGAVLGTAAALDGTVLISGSATECAVRVSAGFYGASFTEEMSLQQSPGTQPWCTDS